MPKEADSEAESVIRELDALAGQSSLEVVRASAALVHDAIGCFPCEDILRNGADRMPPCPVERWLAQHGWDAQWRNTHEWTAAIVLPPPSII